VYPGSIHVRDLGLIGASDIDVWQAAVEGGFVLVSKDIDFFQRSSLFGAPPKVIWLRVGNGPSTSVAALLRERYLVVRRFYEDADASFLPLASVER
jgi:predicted nuclease of predicted toxin-antitoxin system